MSDTYTKLFSSITESTVWGESYATRIVWVTMLAMADASGNVYGSVPGLARRANVTLQEIEAALTAFLAPDAYSRTRDEDGRRISEIDGGWKLINHAKYSAVRGAEERREYKREWDRAKRPSGHARASQSDTVRQQSDESPTKSDSPAPPALTPTPVKHSVANATGADAPPDADPIWHTGLAFLERKGIPTAQARKFLGKLKREAGDIDAAALLADAEAQDITEPIPWLSQAAVNARNRPRAGPAQQLGKTAQGIAALEEMKRGLASNGTTHGLSKAALPRLGAPASR